METSLRLYSSEGLNLKERWYIYKRLEAHCVAYIVTARRAGFPVKVGKVVSVVVRTRSVGLAVKAFLYGVRADQSDTVRKIGRAMKRVWRLARG